MSTKMTTMEEMAFWLDKPFNSRSNSRGNPQSSLSRGKFMNSNSGYMSLTQLLSAMIKQNPIKSEKIISELIEAKLSLVDFKIALYERYLDL
jgi:hypothetical protein